MRNFTNQIQKHIKLSEEAELEIISKLKIKSYSKGQEVNKVGQICRYFFFIEKGLVKSCYQHKDRNYILRFFSENDFFTSLDSYTLQVPAQYSSIAIEDTTVIYIHFEDLELLAKKYHSIEHFLRLVYSFAALKNLDRIRDHFNNDASELYNDFTKTHQHLLQRISLGDIASYLGVSQVTLSRIRGAK